MPTINVAFPGFSIIERMSIKSRFMVPTSAIVVTRPSISSSIQPDPVIQSVLRCLACQASLSILTLIHTWELESKPEIASLAIERLNGCSANGSPAMDRTRQPLFFATDAISDEAPEPIPPPNPVSINIISAFSISGITESRPSLSLCVAIMGSAAEPLPSPPASRKRQLAVLAPSNEVSSASIRSSSDRS